MDYFRGSFESYRTPAFKAWMKPPFNKPTNMPSVSNCVVLDYPFRLKKGIEQLPSTKFSQPPPFLVGGFVGSKICDKNGSVNYSDLLGQIFATVTSLTPNHTQRKPYGEGSWRRKPIPAPKNCPKVTSPIISEILTPSVVISSPSVTQQTVLPISPPIMPNHQENKQSPLRTASESSDTSWASISQEENRNVLISNPWLSNIVVCVSDSDDEDDSNSDWDAVEDFQSENGEVIDDFKWNGDSLSPISSPICQTPPVIAAALDDYDSDESDGVLICCGHGYIVDEEEEARERKLAEERIHDANRRWNQQMSAAVDQIDGIRKKTPLKKVHFPPDHQLIRVRPMLTWTHAHRAARRGDWERFARDADRFRERIDSTAAILTPILDPLHRDRIRQRNLEYDIQSETI